MKHGFAKVMLGVYLVSTFLFCAVLPKENPSVQRVWERVRPDAGALGMYCVSSAYPNFNLADGTRLNAEHGQTREMDPVHIFPINGDKENAVISRHFSTFTVNLVQAKSSKNKGF